MGVDVKGGERNIERGGLFVGAFRGGDTDDVGQLAGGEEFTELGDDEGRCGAGAEAEDHAAADVLHGLIGGELLEVVLGEDRRWGWGGEGSN